MKKLFVLLMLGGLLVACDQATTNTAANEAANVETEQLVADENPDLWLGSLITANPQEGRELAIKMARKTIGAIQSDGEVKQRLRGQYAEDAGLLILSAEVVAIEYQTVAAANNYWQ